MNKNINSFNYCRFSLMSSERPYMKEVQQGIVASSRQKMNPVTSHIKNVHVKYSDDLPVDFLCGPETSVVYITLKFARAYRDYLENRLSSLNASGRNHRVRVVLALSDLEGGAQEPEADVLEAGRNVFDYFSGGEIIVLVRT